MQTHHLLLNVFTTCVTITSFLFTCCFCLEGTNFRIFFRSSCSWLNKNCSKRKSRDVVCKWYSRCCDVSRQAAIECNSVTHNNRGMKSNTDRALSEHYITSNDLGNDLRTTRSHTQLPKNNLIFSLQIILNSMHKYQPRFHVILEETDKTQSRGKGQTRTFTFNETQFMAVTAYQNHMVSLSYHKKRIFGIALEITSAAS